MKNFGIIGAGLTGLTIAHRLTNKGARARVFESQSQVGGVIQSFSEGSFMAEAGPHSLLVRHSEIIKLFDNLNLNTSIVIANPTAKKRFLVKDGKLEALPASLIDFLRTPLLSARGKLRLLREPFITARKEQTNEESFGAFVARRLGIETLNAIADPWVSGIHAGDPEQLSVRHAFGGLWKMEKKWGSLTRGGIQALKAMRKRRRTHAQNNNALLPKSKMLSFREGMQTLPLALAKMLPERSLFTDTKITAIHKNEKGWRVNWSQQNNNETETFDELILAVPAHQLSQLPFENAESLPLTAFESLPHPPVSVLTLGFHRKQITHPLDGFGALIPNQENCNILGIIFASTLFPNRAPEDHVTLSVFIGGARHPGRATGSTDELCVMAQKEIEALLGLSGEPVFTKHVYWPNAIPQYNLNYGSFLEAIADCKRRYPTLHLAGSYCGGISVENCLLSGLKLADILC